MIIFLNFLISLLLSPSWAEQETELLKIKQISHGLRNACALLENDGVKCWGGNESGQLGYGNTTSLGNTPATSGDNLPFIDFDSPTKPIQVVANYGSTCVLFESGQVKCWGDNSSGQLGYEDTKYRGHTAETVPAKLPFLDFGTNLKVQKITGRVGSFYCALFNGGEVKCWGNNASGQLGLGSAISYGAIKNTMGTNLPFLKFGVGKKVIDIVAGGYHACVLLDTDEVKCWGEGNSGKNGSLKSERLGDSPNETPDLLPAIDLGVKGARPIQLSASGTHTCVLFDNGKAKCFGQNGFGELGLGHNNFISTGNWLGENLGYMDLGELPIIRIDAFNVVTCAQFINFAVKCVGRNEFGALAYGDIQHRGLSPQTVGDNLEFVNLGAGEAIEQVSGHFRFTCFVTKAGAMKCVGENNFGQLAYGDTKQRGHTPNTTPDLLGPVNLGTKTK